MQINISGTNIVNAIDWLIDTKKWAYVAIICTCAFFCVALYTYLEDPKRQEVKVMIDQDQSVIMKGPFSPAVMQQIFYIAPLLHDCDRGGSYWQWAVDEGILMGRCAPQEPIK